MKSLPAIIWAFMILVLCIMPSGEDSILSQWDFPHLDKLIHAWVYSLLGFLSLRAIWPIEGKISKQTLLAVWVIIGIYGVVIEFLQHYISTGRRFEVWDIIANIGGAAIGIAVFCKIRKII